MGANCFKRIIKKIGGKNLFLQGANKKFFRGKCEWKRGIFLCLVLGVFVWGQLHIFWGQFYKYLGAFKVKLWAR